MTRQQKLQAYFDQTRSRQFQAGTHDCAIFVAEWVKIATGVDHARGWRAAYRSLKDGTAMLQEAGYLDHVDLAASILPEIAPALARTGDLAVVNGNALGIVSDERVFVLRLDGLGHLSRRLAERAFRV